MREAAKFHKCKMMIFANKGGYSTLVLLMFVISVIIFMALTFAATFLTDELNEVPISTIVIIQLAFFIWGALNFLALIAPGLILPKLDGGFDQKITDLWKKAHGMLKTIETSSEADKPIRKPKK